MSVALFTVALINLVGPSNWLNGALVLRIVNVL